MKKSLKHLPQLKQDEKKDSDIPSLSPIYLHHNISDDDLKEKYGFTDLMIACKNNELRTVKWLNKKSYREQVNQQNKDQSREETALHIACRYGDPQIITALLNYPTININCQDKNGNTPLHIASKAGHLAIVQLLDEHKIGQIFHKYYDLNYQRQNKRGEDAFYCACESGNEQLINWFFDNYDVNIDHSISVACENNNDKILSLLLDKLHRNFSGDDIIKSAWKNCHEKIVAILLNHPKVKFNQMYLTIEYEHKDLLWLLNNDSDAINIHISNVLELLTIACKNNDQEMVKNIIKSSKS